MIKNITISNYKSIENISLDLGKINVFIGENGAGKSNILEAIALASAAAENKLDNEFLAARGIRVTDSLLMTQGFEKTKNSSPIKIEISDDNQASAKYILANDHQPYSNWQVETEYSNTVTKKADDIHLKEFRKIYEIALGKELDRNTKVNESSLKKIILTATKQNNIKALEFILGSTSKIWPRNSAIDKTASRFIIYSADNNSLRDFKKSSTISPIGINGEGLFKLIKFESSVSEDFLNDLKSFLKFFGWFKNLEITEDISSQSCIKIIDKFIENTDFSIDLRSANEGFLFLIFYFSIFKSALTPHFFAIDNIDSSLNPKLCTALMEKLVELSKNNDKQAILTTHNPAILDGLNLNDDNQKLFIIHRNADGRTEVRNFKYKPNVIEGRQPQKLSQLFMSGALGGVPKFF